MNRILLLTLLLTVNIGHAMPKHFEVWFLSVDRSTFLKPLLKEKGQSRRLYSMAPAQCQKMGEYCFDPQVGLYKVDSYGKVDIESDYKELDKHEKYENIDSARSIDRNLIECDGSNFFDIFCGKSKKSGKLVKAKLEMWLDISTTMKQVDFQGFDQMCFRESLLRRVNKACPLNEKMKVYIFDESRRELGSFDRVCLNSGLNRIDRIMRDIKSSTAQKLIIITDIYEAQESFISFIENSGTGVVRGIEKPIYASEIMGDVDRLVKMCQ